MPVLFADLIEFPVKSEMAQESRDKLSDIRA
jgi:hypothetical protein